MAASASYDFMINDLKQYIQSLAEPVVKSFGLEIWGLEIIGKPKTTVRLFVDLPARTRQRPESANMGGLASVQALYSATIEQCEEVSRQLGLALEVEDRIEGHWVLEVSSPGLERKFFELEQMRPYLGEIIDVRLKEPLTSEGRKSYRGKLIAVGAGFFDLEPCAIADDGRLIPENPPQCRIPWNMARNVSRVHIFAVPAKPGKKRKRPA